MSIYEAPAKVNLALLVGRRLPDGYHQIESLVQTVEWVDVLEVEEAEQDSILVEGMDLDPEDNLVVRAIHVARTRFDVPPLALRLKKEVPPRAGLGGGSSDAAAMLHALIDRAILQRAEADEIGTGLGSDVPLFFIGGTVVVRGTGEVIDRHTAVDGFALAVAVPRFELATAEVYRKWDELEGPEGEELPPGRLPPGLRGGLPIRNDLTPAAISLVPELADFIAELRHQWQTPVAMTGSGSACFGFFPTLDEAVDAATSVSDMCRASRGVNLRSVGVNRVT